MSIKQDKALEDLHFELPVTVKEAIRLAISEDEGHGDITSTLVIPSHKTATAQIIAKEDFILAGMPFVRQVLITVDKNIELKIFFKEGSLIKNGDVIAQAKGRARSLLLSERVSLNMLQRVSGIATFTNAFVNKLKGFSTVIVDTRKTTPGFRFMEKYGVRIGGGVNHRFGLYDGILIKDNHIKIAGSITKAIKLARRAHHLLKIEVEVKNIKELKEALAAGADIIMLDNMTLKDMKEAVRIRDAETVSHKQKVLLEASGGVRLDNVSDIAGTGIDIISIGSLTHSAKAVDISMKIV